MVKKWTHCINNRGIHSTYGEIQIEFTNSAMLVMVITSFSIIYFYYPLSSSISLSLSLSLAGYLRVCVRTSFVIRRFAFIKNDQSCFRHIIVNLDFIFVYLPANDTMHTHTHTHIRQLNNLFCCSVTVFFCLFVCVCLYFCILVGRSIEVKRNRSFQTSCHETSLVLLFYARPSFFFHLYNSSKRSFLDITRDDNNFKIGPTKYVSVCLCVNNKLFVIKHFLSTVERHVRIFCTSSIEFTLCVHREKKVLIFLTLVKIWVDFVNKKSSNLNLFLSVYTIANCANLFEFINRHGFLLILWFTKWWIISVHLSIEIEYSC